MQYKGRIIFEGYAISDILVYEENNKSRQRDFSEGKDSEYDRFEYARRSAIRAFDELYETTLKTVGEDKAALFQTYRLMAEDIDFEDLVRSNINDGQTAEDAITNASKQLADSFAVLEDEYMKQRAADVIEVGKNLVNVLLGSNQIVKLTKPTILICDDLAASVLMRMDRKFLKGLVLVNGNENSHVAIFARTLELPTICGVGNFNLSTALNGKKGIVDAIKGRLIINPSQEELDDYDKLVLTEKIMNINVKQNETKEILIKDNSSLSFCVNDNASLILKFIFFSEIDDKNINLNYGNMDIKIYEEKITDEEINKFEDLNINNFEDFSNKENLKVNGDLENTIADFFNSLKDKNIKFIESSNGMGLTKEDISIINYLFEKGHFKNPVFDIKRSIAFIPPLTIGYIIFIIYGDLIYLLSNFLSNLF